MSLRHLGVLLAAVLATATAGCGSTTTASGLAPSPSSSAASKPTEQDRDWMRAIHQGNLAEIQAGHLGQTKGSSKSVKAIGKLLVDDHTKADAMVIKTARQLDIHLPGSPSGAQNKQADALENASQADFDEDWISAMTKAHKDAVAATKKEIKKGSAPEVKSLAESTLPVLERHLTELKKADAG
jgi:putative membrane protein